MLIDTDKTPCLGCKDRWINENGRCHSSCDKYKEFLEAHASKSRLIEDERKRTMYDPLLELKTDAQINWLRKEGKKKKKW